MICHTESQRISLFCSYNYNALMMQKQMIMEQYRNNKTLNNWFFFCFYKGVNQIGCFTTSTTDWWSGLCLLKMSQQLYIIYKLIIIVTHQICHVLALPTVHTVYCSIKINSPQLMGKTRHKIMLKTRWTIILSNLLWE